jgi:hypothetical protein
MGVIAARRSGLRISTPVRRLYRTSTSSSVRSASLRPLGSNGSHVASPMPRWAVGERKAFWTRFQDDRDLIRLKVVLLTSLVLLTALLEWVA